ncbi:hypothetical protein AB4865_07630 [Capnocytophaga sp. ARDL2]
MDEEEYIKHYKAIDFERKIQNISLYHSVKRAVVEVVNEMFEAEG